MKYIVRILCISLLFHSLEVKSQDNNLEALTYNIGFNILTGTVGALINKRKDQKLKDVLLRGTIQGAASGYFIYESKQFIYRYQKNDNAAYAWGGKIVNSIGVSMAENTSKGEVFWSNYHINFGFLRFDFDCQNNFRFQPRLMPISFGSFVYLTIYSKPSFTQSLLNSEMTFLRDENNIPGISEAGALTNNIVVFNKESGYDNIKVTAHEIIHTYQYYDFNSINMYFNKPIKYFRSQGNLIKKFDRFIYFDFNAISSISAYLYSTRKIKNGIGLYNTFYEKEAVYYSERE